MADKHKILIVEDDKYIINFISMSLKKEDYDYVIAKTCGEANALFYANRPDMIILDLGLPDGDGIEIIKNVREIEYGKFLVGYENGDGLNLVYNNIGSAIYEEIVNDIKEDGFIDVLEIYNEEGYGKFVATNGKSLQVTLEFSGFSKQLVITFKEIE